MRWFDEFPQLFRRPISEIGFAFYVREKMKNDLRCDRDELRQTLGPEWAETVENLRKNGIMSIEKTDGIYRFTVSAPGDRKRDRCRKIGRRKRAIALFEDGLIESNLKGPK